MARFPTRENPTPQPVSDADHVLWCWEGEGPGAKLRTEVRKDIASIKSRISWFNGGTAALSAIGLVVLAAWLSSRFSAAERSAVKRQDVEAAIQRSVEMATAKKLDDQALLQQMFDRAQVQGVPTTTAKTKGIK